MASFCINCAATLEPDAKFCGACGTTVGQPVVATVPLAAARQPPAAPARRYPALRIISVTLKILAVVTVVAGLIFGITRFADWGVLAILGSLIYGLFLWASAEMIHVVLEIEENTRRGAGKVG